MAGVGWLGRTSTVLAGTYSTNTDTMYLGVQLIVFYVCNVTALLVAEFIHRQRWINECAWNIGVRFQSKPNIRRKTCPSATFCTKISKWTGLRLNPSLLGEKPATNRKPPEPWQGFVLLAT